MMNFLPGALIAVSLIGLTSCDSFTSAASRKKVARLALEEAFLSTVTFRVVNGRWPEDRHDLVSSAPVELSKLVEIADDPVYGVFVYYDTEGFGIYVRTERRFGYIDPHNSSLFLKGEYKMGEKMFLDKVVSWEEEGM